MLMKIDTTFSNAARIARGVVLLLTAVGMMAVDLPVYAGGNAYWRHEEGTAGSLVPDGPNTVTDSSGDGNHMRTFSSANPPYTAGMYSSEVSPLPLRSGLSNNLSIDFGPNTGGGGLNNDNYTDGKDINSHKFEAITIEMAFNMNAVSGFQALMGKDGKPLPGSPVPPLKMMVRGDNFPNAIDNQLFVEWIDGNGAIHSLAGGSTITAGNWNHLAFVLTDTDAELWVAGETTPYTLVDSIQGAAFAGPGGEVLIDHTGSFTVGRGMWDGGVGDWANALIDEVRVSDVALNPNQFLFVAIPEPNSLVLALAGLAMFGGRRRRQ